MRASSQTLKRLAVLKAIRRHGPISRTELPRLTGLSGGSITQFTADLAKRGLLSERRENSRAMGRPRVQLAIEATAGLVVGAKLSSRMGYLEVTFVNLSGRELFARAIALQQSHDLAGFGEAIAAAILQAVAMSPFNLDAITRVSIALPAIVDARRGIVHSMTTFPPVPFGLAELLSQRLQAPITIENDLSCMARAEHWLGRAQELATFTFIRVGHSVDLAEYRDGLPKVGQSGLNSEIGHIKMGSASPMRSCFCGGEGCLNTFSSMFGVLSRTELTEEIPPTHLEDVDAKFHMVLDRVERDDENARVLLDEAADYLAVAVSNYIVTTNPGVILVALESHRFLRAIEARFLAALSRNTLAVMLEATRIEMIVADPNWWRMGTAALALEQTYLGMECMA